MTKQFYEQGKWVNKPMAQELLHNVIKLTTMPNTDFWQRTNYGYQTDNGHILLNQFTEKEFTFYTKATFSGKILYDQCGIMLYQSDEQWAKISAEKGKGSDIMLGSVVTQHGYSDWAISENLTASNNQMTVYYRISRKSDDFLVEYSTDGQEYLQLRMFHLFDGKGQIALGIYACSPQDSSFTATFSDIDVTPCVWSEEEHI